MQHSMNNLFIESTPMSPNLKYILNRCGDVFVNSIRIERNHIQSDIHRILKTLFTVIYDNPYHLLMVFKK